MLHLLYVIAFTVLAVIAVSNMIRSMVRLGTDVSESTGSAYSSARSSAARSNARSGVNSLTNPLRNAVAGDNASGQLRTQAQRKVPHPELLDGSGDIINEPLLVMRSISIKDARDKLNALYEDSSSSEETKDS